jgi:cellulose synthase/poly-beta-1,6-N-acetylglucosamine synthase-like glycosyltransferase
LGYSLPSAIALLRFILPEAAPDDAAAATHLSTCRTLGVDPLDYAAHRFELGDIMVLERAARWAGLAFSPVIPPMQGRPDFHRLDSLAEVRTVRARLLGRDVSYIAPLFDEVLKLKARLAEKPEVGHELCLVPVDAIRAEVAAAASERLLDESKQRLARRWPYASGHLDLTLGRRIGFVIGLLALLVLAALAPFWFKPIFVPLVGLFLIVPALFRLVAVIIWMKPDPDAAPLGDADLPIYSVLIPLRDEAHMVPLLRQAMARLDYPPEKLDLKFVVEEKSADTVAAVREVLADPRFELVVVPEAMPHTKPKALNYALPLLRGTYVVVFDAEDVPDPTQLRRAASRFAADPGLDCLQAELVIDNAPENLLTGLFAAEYAGQFGLMLPLLASWKLPMPLGGTSNHFRTQALRELGGWDAFNVTEDADLGVRLARLRYRSATFQSQTREEAPVSLASWMTQRTRWMKGWMQTFIVHNRSPLRFLDDIGWKGFLAFQIYVGSMILSALLHTVFLAAILASAIFGTFSALPRDGWDVVTLVILVLGYGGAVALVVAGLLRLREQRLLIYQLGLPLYWVLHSIAALRAAYELLVRPHFWGKTEHGRTKLPRRLDQR